MGRYHVDRTQGDERRFVALVRQVERAIDAGVFPPRLKSYACPSCPYRNACDGWAA